MVMLAGVVIVLTVLVFADNLGGHSADDASGASADAAQVVVERAAQLKQAESIASQEDAWRGTLAANNKGLEDARSRMIEAPSVDIAGAKLREVVQQVMGDVGVTLDVSDAVTPINVVADEPLHVIGLQLQFQTSDMESLYALVDRLEHMPDLMTNVSRLQVLGPGRAAGAGLDVTMDVRALSWIARETQ